MIPPGLSWRLGLPVLLLVLVATVSLAWFLIARLEVEDHARMARLAVAHADFIVQKGLPASERMAGDLRGVTGYEVHFRNGGALLPDEPAGPLRTRLMSLPADGVVRTVAGIDLVGVPLRDDSGLLRGELLLGDPRSFGWLDPQVLPVLAAFWLLALLTALVVARQLVRPLRNLARHMPSFDTAAELRVDEVARRDEIGDLARAFVRARNALRDERERREQAEKLAMLGRMTASLAHEIQNPVAAIKLHAQLWAVAEQDAPGSVIEREAQRIEDLVNQWMFLTRPEPPAFGHADLGELLADVVAGQSARAAHARVTVHVETRGDLRLSCDRRRLGHVFANVLGNAIQALPSGGAVAISVSPTAGGQSLTVRVHDDGRGFSAAALVHFAEFFFSEREGGMGIGLAVANEIVKAHRGCMTAANDPDGGACVTIELPRRSSRVPGIASRIGGQREAGS